ncbi:insulin-like 3 (Leydig cell) [Centroberyx affinis]|uniref:insulin-like 3 (Leydig cell) n=1 Tax=Centroberyx affinis TaxID=166261 RepID=UPI003A5B96D8
MSATKCVVSLMVVLVAGVCAVHAQDRIKICGRELIRLAVSSCGNSRLRRSIPDLELDQHHDNSLREQGFSTEEHQVTSEILGSPAPSDGESTDFFLAPHWFPQSSRVRRAAGRLSDICCEKGCSVKELIQFC